jgi:hypothetical protein
MLTKYRGVREISHGGDGVGSNTWNAHYPDFGLTVIVLSNVSMRPAGPLPNADDLARAIAAIYLGDRMLPEEKVVEVKLDPKLLQSYAGVYKVTGRQEVLDAMGDTVALRVEDGRLAAYTKMPKVILCAESENSFYAQYDDTIKLAFTLDAQGRVTGLVFHVLGLVEMPGTRIAD